MHLQTLESKKVLFCPARSLFSLSRSGLTDEDCQMLSGCFRFSSEVKPCRIQYDPDKITVITSNEMFRPMDSPCSIVQPKKQMLQIVTEDDVLTLKALLQKPILLCVTRRHQFDNLIDVSSSDTDAISNRCTVSGFDIDFAIILLPGLFKKNVHETLELIHVYIIKKRQFCFTIDFKQVLTEELTPQELQESADSLEYVSRHNTTFWLTNHCKPHHSLMYVNTVLFWTTLFPYASFVALPFRTGHRLLCKDKRLAVRTPMKFKYGHVGDKVLVSLWTNEPPPPGEYHKNKSRFSITAANLNCLRPFLRDSSMITFDLNEEKGGDCDEQFIF